jgi:hypothetical protein
MYLNIIKAIYDKLRANIILNGEKQMISPKLRNKTRAPTLLTPIQLVLEFLARAVRQEKEIKGKQLGKEIIKT